jgi:HAE1 family hydrophobic/amphiphilic exporter-1
LRPILMTAIATIFALLPMAFGLTGEGGFISQPLAIVVIGGLVSSTLLTLVLVPTLYTMVENRKEKSRAKRVARRTRKAGGPPKHAAADPEALPAETAPEASAGAHQAAEAQNAATMTAVEPGSAHQAPEPQNAATTKAAEPGSALTGYTDQFEVLKMPRRPSAPRA